VWAKMLGGAYSEGDGIGVDAAGNVYTAGYFTGTGDFDPGPGVFIMNATGGDFTYITKFNSSGELLWAVQFVGSNYSYPVGLTLDANSNVHLVGSFAGTVDFDPGPGESTQTAVGEEDIYVVKLTSAGNHLWSRA